MAVSADDPRTIATLLHVCETIVQRTGKASRLQVFQHLTCERRPALDHLDRTAIRTDETVNLGIVQAQHLRPPLHDPEPRMNPFDVLLLAELERAVVLERIELGEFLGDRLGGAISGFLSPLSQQSRHVARNHALRELHLVGDPPLRNPPQQQRGHLAATILDFHALQSSHWHHCCTLYGCTRAACWISSRLALADRTGGGGLSPANSTWSPNLRPKEMTCWIRRRASVSAGSLGVTVKYHVFMAAHSR